MADPLPTSLPDAPRAGGETQRWLDALDDAIATANAEAHDETQKARYRKAGRETSSALRELRSALPSLLERQRDGERLTLPGDQVNHAIGWLAGGEAGELSDDAIVKLTDAKGRAICSLTAKWLRALVALPRPERQTPTWEPGVSAPSAERASE